MSKLIQHKNLLEVSEKFRKQGKKIVHCHGCFDLLHIGHIKYLRKAKTLGDILFVTITADKFVNKGPERPIFNQHYRAEHIAELSIVDYIAISDDSTAVDSIKKIKPDFYVKGNEYENLEEDISGNIVEEKNEVERWGGSIYFTNEETFSSSHLLNNHFGVFPEETESYLKKFRDSYSLESVLAAIEDLKTLNIAVIGDTIIDEYHYTEPLGQTGKGNVLAVKYGSHEKFPGGAIAVSNHIAGYVKNVDLLTGIGTDKCDESFLREKLLPNVNPHFLYYKSAPTIVKRRYVDKDSDANRLFEVYFYDENSCDDKMEKEAIDWIKKEAGKYDAVVVPDFGNGFIVGGMIDAIANSAKFLAVNTQINSGNRGYHLITRYPRADFISLNEPELRFAAHDRKSSIIDLAEKISKELDASQIAITRGRSGALLISNAKEDVTKVPALSTKVIDRIGAGDTFLSLASICLVNKVSPDISLFVASAAAALDVQIVCNREPVDSVSLIKYIKTLMK